jgi:aryl-alcohol dehydrogenase-like predicted oxidoreductase
MALSLFQQRPLGASGLNVSPLGLGTVKFGRNQAVKYPRRFALPSDHAIDRLLGQAAEIGINLLDTAPAYGSSEERLGKMLSGRRERWVIATKAGEEFSDDRSHFDFSAAAIEASVRRSLKRLQTDRLDIVLLHSDGADESEARFGAAIETLARLKREGAIRASGFSGKSAAGFAMARHQVDVLMVTFNIEDETMRPAIRAAHGARNGVLVKKPLGSGHLVPDKAALDKAMAFIFAESGVTAAIVGTLDAAHLAADAEAVERALKRQSRGDATEA